MRRREGESSFVPWKKQAPLTSSWFLCGRIVCCFSNQGDLLMLNGEVCLGGGGGGGGGGGRGRV